MRVVEISKENIKHTQTSGNLMKTQAVWIFVQLCFWLLYFRSIILGVIFIFKIIWIEYWLVWAPSPAWKGHSLSRHMEQLQERECEIQTAGTELKRFLTTAKGLHDCRILGDSSAFGRDSGLAGTKSVLNFFFPPFALSTNNFRSSVSSSSNSCSSSLASSSQL